MSKITKLEETIHISNKTNELLDSMIKRNNDIIILATETSRNLKAQGEVFKAIDKTVEVSSNSLLKKRSKCIIL